MSSYQMRCWAPLKIFLFISLSLTVNFSELQNHTTYITGRTQGLRYVNDRDLRCQMADASQEYLG